MTRPDTLEQKLAASWPPEGWRDVRVVVAVSGGADSVALLRVLAALKVAGPGQLLAAHFNHRLRGEASEGDEQFVVELCRQLGLSCETGRAGEGLRSSADGDGLEAAARHARYEFLQATAQRSGARYVVTAHTADDQAETILHRVLRGTGLAGLAGIPRARPLGPDVSLLRPMLDIRRTEVLEYLSARGQSFREDATNAELRFTRNRLRHDLIPKLAAEYNAAVPEALLRLGQQAADAQRVIAALVQPLDDRAVRYADGTALIDCQVLAGQPDFMVRQLLVVIWNRADWPMQDMGFGEWRALAEMVLATEAPAQRVFPGRITAQRQGAELRLTATE